MVGSWGAGKTALVSALAESARTREIRVLSRIPFAPENGPGGRDADNKKSSRATAASMTEAERAPFAGLRALLDSLPMARSCLPPTQRAVLDRVLSQQDYGLAPYREETADVGPASSALSDGPLSVGLAITGLLAAVSANSDNALLAVVDDVHLLDRASLDALAFVCRRLPALRADIVVTAPERALPESLAPGAEEIELGPLPDRDVHRLLDRRTRLPHGGVRRVLVAQAAGNPLAVLEFAHAAERDFQALLGWPDDRPLLCSPETVERFRSVLAKLPRQCRQALLVLAAASGKELVAATDPEHFAADVWSPAESAGLIQVTAHGASFVHPLMRSAVYHGAAPEDRARAHQALARALASRPDRRAWHLAEAVEPGTTDSALSELLEQNADLAATRHGPIAAALALERGAVLAGDIGDRAARMLVRAADHASRGGVADWSRALSLRAAAVARDTKLRDTALGRVGRSLARFGTAKEALDLLLPLSKIDVPRDAELAQSSLLAAAEAAYFSGQDEHRKAVLSVAASYGPDPAEFETADIDATMLAVRASLAPFHRRDSLVTGLDRLSSHLLAVGGSDPGLADRLRLTGTTAWFLDESETAVRILTRAPANPKSGGYKTLGLSTAALAWAFLDTGRWSRTAAMVGHLLNDGVSDAVDITAALCHAAAATMAAYRGEHDDAAVHWSVAESLQSDQSGVVTARLEHAQALTALAAAEHEDAYRRLGALLRGPGGAPAHFQAAYYAAADFALAAQRLGRQAEARIWLADALDHFDGHPSPRLACVFAHANALLADSDTAAEDFYRTALGPGSEQWRVEHARARLHYAEWLRRRHRAKEATPLLIDVRRAFETVGAVPAITRVNDELRAAGAAVAPPDDIADRRVTARSWAALSEHQRRILRLAARGMSNKDIAERVGLAPRTIGSHLYRAFPLLGIGSRHQLRDVIARVDEAELRDSDNEPCQ